MKLVKQLMGKSFDNLRYCLNLPRRHNQHFFDDPVGIPQESQEEVIIVCPQKNPLIRAGRVA